MTESLEIPMSWKLGMSFTKAMDSEVLRFLTGFVITCLIFYCFFLKLFPNLQALTQFEF